MPVLHPPKFAARCGDEEVQSAAIKEFYSGLADLGIFDRSIRQRHLGVSHPARER